MAGRSGGGEHVGELGEANSWLVGVCDHVLYVVGRRVCELVQKLAVDVGHDVGAVEGGSTLFHFSKYRPAVDGYSR